MYIAFQKPNEALINYFNHFFYNLRVGLVTSITGSQFLKTGTGKSYTALRIAELLDKEFDMSKVAYYPREFLKAIDLVEENTSQGTGKPRPGQVVIMDEGEITAPSSLWYSFTNRAIAYTLATFRYLRGMAIIVTPTLSWIDKRMRVLTSHWGYTEKVFSARKVAVKLRMYRVTTDLFGEKIYFRKIRMYDATRDRIVSFKEFFVNLPSEDLVEEYEKKSRKFKKTLRSELLIEVEKFEKYQKQKPEGEKKNLEEIAKMIIDNKELRKRLFINNRVYPEHIRHELPELNLTFAEARIVARLVKKMWNGG